MHATKQAAVRSRTVATNGGNGCNESRGNTGNTRLRPNGGLQLGRRRFAEREREEGVIAVTTVGLCRVGRQGRDKFPIKLGFDCSSLI